jgi:hypothetical protein
MKIEVLYVPGCPNHTPAVEAVMRVSASESLRTELVLPPSASTVVMSNRNQLAVTVSPADFTGTEQAYRPKQRFGLKRLHQTPEQTHF